MNKDPPVMFPQLILQHLTCRIVQGDANRPSCFRVLGMNPRYLPLHINLRLLQIGDVRSAQPRRQCKITTGFICPGSSRIRFAASSLVSQRMRLFFGTGHLMFGAFAIHRHSLAAQRSNARMKARCVALVAAAAGLSLNSRTGFPLLSRLSLFTSQLDAYA